MHLTREELDLYSLIKENYSGSLTMHKYMTLTEADKVSISKGLIDQIYVIIPERYKSINFEMIPKSMGKIRNMKEYDNLVSSLELLSNIAKDSKQNIPEIGIISKAVDNIIKYEDTFYTGFVRKNSPIIMTYNLLTMAVYCATSLMISVLVDFINAGLSGDQSKTTENVDIIINNKYRRHNSYLMIDALKRFNEQVQNGTFDKAMQLYMKQNARPISESVTLTTGLIIFGIIALLKFIPIVKELIYLFYYTRLQLSEAFAIQANLINGNLEALRNKGVSKDSRMYKIQKWFADKLTKLSDKFAFTYEKGEKQAEIESKVKLTPEDIMLF